MVVAREGWGGVLLNINCNYTNVAYVLLTLLTTCYIIGSELTVARRRWQFVMGLACAFTFLVDNPLLFIVIFETLSILMAVNIWKYGSGQRKNLAALKLVGLSLIPSSAAVLIIIVQGCNLLDLSWANLGDSSLVHLALLSAFGSKLAIVPLHSWLPEAHVEADTSDSIFLAAILLKVGGFGLIMSLYSSVWGTAASALLVVWGLLSSLWAGLWAVRQADMKRIIAYSSIAHVSLVLVTVVNLSPQAIHAAHLLLISHAFSAAGLFAFVGILYVRYHTRLVHYFRGLGQIMTLGMLLGGILLLINCNFPGTMNFLAEINLILQTLQISKIATCGVVVSGGIATVFSFWLGVRLYGGRVQSQITQYTPLSNREVWLLLLPILATVGFGLKNEMWSNLGQII